ncbi:hypothetical protein B0J11DRAFT_277588 [Dendryphion nanum]|uniref:Uncharacterized protein n=1 Tax=Dendryphion nanum TaxID=256645 RepID=A0A9P9E136_9PLEO|nr:hypothetical protein B0J11DRAFT_277588 [Dendryphion nanum]
MLWLALIWWGRGGRGRSFAHLSKDRFTCPIPKRSLRIRIRIWFWCWFWFWGFHLRDWSRGVSNKAYAWCAGAGRTGHPWAFCMQLEVLNDRKSKNPRTVLPLGREMKTGIQYQMRWALCKLSIMYIQDALPQEVYLLLRFRDAWEDGRPCR